MLKMKADRDGNPLIVFGLTEENITLLKAGQPMLIKLSELGLVGEVFIFAGDTNESMLKQLQVNGYLPANEAGGVGH